MKDRSLLIKDFKPGQLVAGAPGPAGQQGPKGDVGPKGDAGTPAGFSANAVLVRTYNAAGTQTAKRFSLVVFC